MSSQTTNKILHPAANHQTHQSLIPSHHDTVGKKATESARSELLADFIKIQNLINLKLSGHENKSPPTPNPDLDIEEN